MSSQQDPSKRIPKSLGTESKLFGQYSLTDLLVACTPSAAVILFTQIALPPDLDLAGVPASTLTIPIALLGLGLGALFVYLTPTHATSLEWIQQFVGFHRGDTELPHDRAKEVTHVERILPQHDAVIRSDGAVIGAVHVDPPTMALATDEEWHSKAQAFEDFVNTTVEFPIQLYSTTETFPAGEYLDTYEARLSDPDVKENPKLSALVENYIEWYEDELHRRRMTIRDHYVVVPVTPREVHFERDGLAEKFAELRILGPVVRALTAPPEVEVRAAMVDELGDRLRRVERGLRNIEDVDATRINAADLTSVIAEFWAGEAIDHGRISGRVRPNPIVGGSHR